MDAEAAERCPWLWSALAKASRYPDDSGELALEFAVFSPLKAEEQLLVEHSGDPAQRRT